MLYKQRQLLLFSRYVVGPHKRQGSGCLRAHGQGLEVSGQEPDVGIMGDGGGVAIEHRTT
jgi:hypothetical protein